MLKSKHIAAIIVMATFLCAGNVIAGQLYFGVHGGLSFYSLSDLNDDIDTINNVVGADYLDNVKKGFDYGLQFGLQLSPAATLGIGYSRLNGNTKYSDASVSIEFGVPANVYELHFTYLPPSEKTARFGFGGNLGMISSAGSLDISTLGQIPDRADISGSGILIAGFGALDLSISKSASVFSNLGYRFASINEVEINDVTWKTDNGDDYKLDYNGIFFRVGLKVTFQ